MSFALGHQLVPMTMIDVVARVRPVDEAYAHSLAANMEEHGLQTAITLRVIGERLQLVIGGHRHRGAQILEWEEIPAFVTEMSDEEAEIAEIDENLIRYELTTLDRAMSLKLRKEAYERLRPETGHGKASKTKSQTFATSSKRFTADVAERTNLSERSVQLAVQIASKLDPDAVANLRGTSMANNQNALQKLAQESAQRQRTLSLQIRDGAKTIDDARTRAGFQDTTPVEELDPQASILARLMQLWVKANDTTKADFLAEVKQAEAAAAKKGARK